MMQQNNRQKTETKKVWQILLTVITLFAGIGLLGDVASVVICWIGGVSFSVNHAASIGIIGGADGPTAVFITSSTPPLWYIASKLLILITGSFGLHHLKRK